MTTPSEPTSPQPPPPSGYEAQLPTPAPDRLVKRPRAAAEGTPAPAAPGGWAASPAPEPGPSGDYAGSDYLAATYPAHGYPQDPPPGWAAPPPAGPPAGAPGGYGQSAYGQSGSGQSWSGQAGHGQAPGYGAQPAYGAQPGYGSGPGGYDAQPGYGGGQPGYGAQPGYGPQPGYGGPPQGHPGQGGYGQPVPYGYGQAPWENHAWVQPPRTDGLSIAALVVGLVSLLTCLVIGGPVAVGLGIAGLRRSGQPGVQGRTQAIWGIVTGGLATLLLVVAVVAVIADPSAFA